MVWALFRRHGVRTAQQQAALFHARERRRDRAARPLELFRTHRFTVAQGSIATGTVFPDRLQELTLSLTVRRASAGSNGILFEFGDSTRGFAAALDGDDLIVAAGDADASTDGATLTLADALPATSRDYRLSIVVIPGKGEALVWIDGEFAGRAVSTSGSFGAGGWSSSGAGAIGAVQGTVIDRIPLGQRVSLANASIIGEVSAFDGQRPRGHE